MPQPPPHRRPPSPLRLIPPLLLFLATVTPHPCPPFTTPTPPWPFSTSPNSGHPSFQIKCPPPPLSATISINNHHFSLLHFDPTTTTATLTTTTATTTTTIPTQPINFSNSPFKPTDSFCSRLSYIRPCHPPTPTPTTHCPWECEITKNPLHILPSCESQSLHPLTSEGCQDDVLSFLESFLKFGIEIEWEQQDLYFTNCKSCKSLHNNGVCGFNSSDPKKPFLCFNSSNPPNPQNPQNFRNPNVKKPNFRVAIMCLAILLLCFLLFILLSSYISRRRSINRRKNENLQDPAVVYLHRHRSASLLPPAFTFDELRSATNNFDPSRKIGDGGFGSVYLGQFNQLTQLNQFAQFPENKAEEHRIAENRVEENRVYAIKYLHKQNLNSNNPTNPSSNSFSTKSFCNEILILSSLNHPNLVKLHGYCSDPRGLLLVYEYVPNGTLSDHLHVHKKQCLPWHVRLEMAIQIATAIEYLHFSVVPAIVHRDITSNNIFVDKEMRVKVGDFGLSRMLELETPGVRGGPVWTGPQGTPGYLDPDYYRSFRLTEKSDVYSFGVVLLELVTGMRAVDVRRDKREMTLADMAVGKIQMGLLVEVIDPRLAAVDGGAVTAVAELSFRCVAADKDDRPDAREVVAELRRIKGRSRGGGSGMVRANSSNVVVPENGCRELFEQPVM